jgi:hypothetical protein
VRVNRPGAKVSSRHGYYARDTLKPYNREEFLAYSRIAAVGGYESEIADLPMEVTTAKTLPLNTFREENQLSWDGTEADYYSSNMEWSPDSSKLAVFRTKPGYKRLVHFIESSPADQLQPKTFSIECNKPGDDLDIDLPVLFHVDGMGTNNRSKALHDVCWKNLGDGGFPDRILWHKAVAAKYPYYDVSRVGVYGTSAGGQSAMGALLFHPEFYKVAVSNSGCHDNRLDKLSWNEQWMGYPVGPEYAAASNVENAHKLQGKLLLVAGELDTNVDPSSTLQVVNALIRANKVFDFLYVPGGGHGAGGEYGDRKRNDFFVHYLLGVEPPDWNQIAAKQK